MRPFSQIAVLDSSVVRRRKIDLSQDVGPFVCWTVCNEDTDEWTGALQRVEIAFSANSPVSAITSQPRLFGSRPGAGNPAGGTPPLSSRSSCVGPQNLSFSCRRFGRVGRLGRRRHLGPAADRGHRHTRAPGRGTGAQRLADQITVASEGRLAVKLYAVGKFVPALQSRVIDATEWVGPWNDPAFGSYKITKNYYGPGFREPSAAIELSVNKGACEGLESDLQAVVENAAAATNVRMLAEFTAANVESQRVLVEEHGVQIRPFPEEVFREMMRHSDDVVRATAEEDDLARRIFESWERFRADARARNPYAEQGYLQLRG